MKDLKDKAFIITGAGGTIAGAVEEALRAEGARVVLVDKDKVRIAGRAKTYNSLAFEADFSSLADAQVLVKQIKTELGRIDGLLHLVGEVVTGNVLDASEVDYEHAFNTNMRTLFNAVKAVLPELLNQDDGFVAGIGAHTTSARGKSGSSLFVASKSAVTAFLRSLDAELAATNVNVSVVFPVGVVDTATNRKRYDDVAFISPQAIASAFVVAAKSGQGGRFLEMPVYPPRS